MTAPSPAPRRFWLRTYGCQMNVHDSEKVANLLYHAGWTEGASLADADLAIVNTCSIRDKAEQRLYSELGGLREWKLERPGRALGVAGCVAQQEGDALLCRFDHVDFVFGPQNVRHVPLLAEAATGGARIARTDESVGLERFDLPERHPDFAAPASGSAFVTVMEGCDMFCSFCIVPLTRGREVSRAASGILAEAREVVARGAREITLLGQTVNAYGRHDVRRGHAAAKGTTSFGRLLRDLAGIPGLARLRYTSPHPAFYDDELIAAHAELGPLQPHVHLPLQSGSDAVLERMRRRYDADTFRRLADRLRRARPGLVLTTDLIVGFPGETDADFRQTLALVRDAGFVDSFSFKYSPRPGTAAATASDAVPADVAQDRLAELQSLQRAQTIAYHRGRVGEETEVLVEGPSRRGGGQQSGRDPQHRVVNFAVAPGEQAVPASSLLRVRIAEATPHSLIGEPSALIGEPSALIGEPLAPVEESPRTGARPPRASTPLKRSAGNADEGVRSAAARR